MFSRSVNMKSRSLLTPLKTESIYIKRVAYDFEGKELDYLRDLTTDQYPEEIRMCAYKEVWTCSEDLDFLNHLLPLMARMEISRLTECKLVKEDSVQAVFIGGAVEENVHRIIQKLDVCLKYWVSDGNPWPC